MALADDVRMLRDRTLADLTLSYDYYEDTKIAWNLVDNLIASGGTFENQNMTTGTVTTQEELASKARGYITKQLPEATFQQILSIFESFCFDLLRLQLTAYPRSLGKKQVDFKSVLDLPDRDAVIQQVVGKELNEVMYETPTAWFAYLEDKVKLGCPSVDEIARIAEAKASRDVLVHNRGIANQIYESKSGKLARFKDGEEIEISEQYHRETWDLIRKLVADVSNALIAKASSQAG